jgi:hypothetical protein
LAIQAQQIAGQRLRITVSDLGELLSHGGSFDRISPQDEPVRRSRAQ